MNICVFCSAHNVEEPYKSAAQKFGTLIGERGHTLVWGGGTVGTMGVVADAAQQAGARIVGVMLQHFKEQERANSDEMIQTHTLAERKAKLLERSDAILVLPGGIGTLDEVTDVMALKKHEAHKKEIVFLNTDGFYSGFKQQLERMNREGFLPNQLSEFVAFADTPQEAMEYIERNAKG